ncbi:unnamed protein product [Ostreobium quekettii]|uniref:Uncharacterized protein n=1 Tax=Ostreobium quekettii TaxID=121088 RepID=A0A8S1IY19_9CHLO|nr:unnamed protein product [Ostreobium quekettii]|eukprot:evm.model.scf_13EXC.10 EVM.evm.TU.scf_13EXC.10   scf_13EXC:139842-140741(+)
MSAYDMPIPPRGNRVSVSHPSLLGGSGAVGIIRSLRLDRHPKVATLVALWLLGLFSAFLSPAPVRITPEMQARFEEGMELVQDAEQRLAWAYSEYVEARAQVQAAQVWFWRFRPEHRKVVRDRQVWEAQARAEVERLSAEKASKLSSAKSELGIWSEAGLSEGRALFWDSYGRGKLFAQRQSLWDAMYSMLLSREPDALGRILNLVAIVCVNFTTGMLMSLLFFVFALPGMIASFRPDILSAIVFFGLASIGALSVIVSFLGLLYGGSVTFVYAIAGPSVGRLDARRRARRIRYRSHYD